jgi:hypothetical protein
VNAYASTFFTRELAFEWYNPIKVLLTRHNMPFQVARVGMRAPAETALISWLRPRFWVMLIHMLLKSTRSGVILGAIGALNTAHIELIVVD